VNIGVYNQNCEVNPSSRPNTIVGYYPAYKYNLKADDLNKLIILLGLNYYSIWPDLISGTGPYTVFTDPQHFDKFNQFRDYLVGNPNRKFQINIDIDYPNKLPCYPPPEIPFTTDELNSVFIPFLNDLSSQLKKSNSSKILTVTAGQYPISGLNSSNSDIIKFVNIQAFYLNIGNRSAGAGIDNIQKIFDAWKSYVNKSKLVLGIDFGGIVEVVTSNNITEDTINQNLAVVSDPNVQLPSYDERIQDLCGRSVYATLSWKNFSNLLLLCDTSTNKDSKWNYGFDNKSQQPYLYQQQQNTPTRYYYVSYDNLQSLKSKLDYVQDNALGIAIFDINKDIGDGTLMNFIIGGTNPTNTSPKTTQSTSTPTSSISQSSPSNVGVIVGGVICSFIFVSALVAAGFILYRRRHGSKMSNPLIDTNNQACSDTNPQIYSDINRQ
ncbi:18049_t:CDS:2, partial [Racocetra persica]